jgi:hypothetical protein
MLIREPKNRDAPDAGEPLVAADVLLGTVVGTVDLDD